MQIPALYLRPAARRIANTRFSKTRTWLRISSSRKKWSAVRCAAPARRLWKRRPRRNARKRWAKTKRALLRARETKPRIHWRRLKRIRRAAWRYRGHPSWRKLRLPKQRLRFKIKQPRLRVTTKRAVALPLEGFAAGRLYRTVEPEPYVPFNRFRGKRWRHLNAMPVRQQHPIVVIRRQAMRPSRLRAMSKLFAARKAHFLKYLERCKSKKMKPYYGVWRRDATPRPSRRALDSDVAHRLCLPWSQHNPVLDEQVRRRLRRIRRVTTKQPHLKLRLRAVKRATHKMREVRADLILDWKRSRNNLAVRRQIRRQKKQKGLLIRTMRRKRTAVRRKRSRRLRRGTSKHFLTTLYRKRRRVFFKHWGYMKKRALENRDDTLIAAFGTKRSYRRRVRVLTKTDSYYQKPHQRVLRPREELTQNLYDPLLPEELHERPTTSILIPSDDVEGEFDEVMLTPEVYNGYTAHCLLQARKRRRTFMRAHNKWNMYSWKWAFFRWNFAALFWKQVGFRITRRAIRNVRLRAVALAHKKEAPYTLRRLRRARLTLIRRFDTPESTFVKSYGRVVNTPTTVSVIPQEIPEYLLSRTFNRRHKPKTRLRRRLHPHTPRWVGAVVKTRIERRRYLRTLLYQPHARVAARAQTLRTYLRQPSTYVRFHYHQRDARLHRYRHQQRHQTYVKAASGETALFSYQFSARARYRRWGRKRRARSKLRRRSYEDWSLVTIRHLRAWKERARAKRFISRMSFVKRRVRGDLKHAFRYAALPDKVHMREVARRFVQRRDSQKLRYLVRRKLRRKLKRWGALWNPFLRPRSRRMERVRGRHALGYKRRRRVQRMQDTDHRWWIPSTVSAPINFAVAPRHVYSFRFRALRQWVPRKRPLVALKPVYKKRPGRRRRRVIRWARDHQGRRSGIAKVKQMPYRFLTLTPTLNMYGKIGSTQQRTWLLQQAHLLREPAMLVGAPDREEQYPTLTRARAYRFPRSGRRHRTPYHFSLHRYVRRLLTRRGRRLSRPRNGLRSTQFTRMQRTYLTRSAVSALPSRAWRRLGGSNALETTKRYFAPRVRARTRRPASRSFLPVLLAALHRRRSERRFVKLCKLFAGRRFKSETRTARREVRGRKRRRVQHRRPRIVSTAKEQWTFNLKGVRTLRHFRTSYHSSWEQASRLSVLHRLRRTRRRGRSAQYRYGSTARTQQVRDTHITKLTPLLFQRRSPYVMLTTEQLDERARHRRLMKLERYRYTAQYAQGLLQLYPALIRRLLPVQGATVRTIYWSLRALLQTTSQTERYASEDRMPKRYKALVNEMMENAEQQSNQRAALLRALQPRRLWRAPRTYRARRFWLRRYNRRRYSFFLEDERRFGSFLPSRSAIYALRPSVETHWPTHPRIVTSPHTTSCTTETLLASKRRTPTLTNVTIGRKSPLPSFFARSFSTYTHYLQQMRRPVTGLLARTHRTPILYAQARAGKLAVRLKSPDPRFTRAKSPRNRRYRVRSTRLTVNPVFVSHTRQTRTPLVLGRQLSPLRYYRQHLRLPRRPLEMQSSGLVTRRFSRRVQRVQRHHTARRLRRHRAAVLHRYRRLRSHLWNRLMTRRNRKLRVSRHWVKDMRISAKFGPWDFFRRRLLRRLGRITPRHYRRAGHPDIAKSVARMTSRLREEGFWRYFSKRRFNHTRRLVRALEWRESDDRFPRRVHFQLRRREYRTAPWVQGIIYRRSIYATRYRREFRRDVAPRKQKRFRWVDRFFKTVLRRRKYIRRWPRMRIYNNLLFRNLFDLPSRRAAVARIKNANSRRHRMEGFANRLDVALLLLNLAPSVRWARFAAAYGVAYVNGEIVSDPRYRLREGDVIRFNRTKLAWVRAYFTPFYRQRRPWNNGAVPRNFVYSPRLDQVTYVRHPSDTDLPKNSRLNARLFRWFRLDSK